MRLKRQPRRHKRPQTVRRLRVVEPLESRRLLAAGIIELGPSDNIALDQPRVAVEFAKDIDPGPAVQWESLGPGLFNTFLLDTGASSVLTMATAIADIEQSRLGWEVQGALLEAGVAGDHLLDVSIPYRFDFAGSNGIRHTLTDARIMSDAKNDFSSFGPWGLVGMPAMEGRVTSLDFTGWSGGGLDLESIYMDTAFRDDVPPDAGHRYTISLDNRLSFDPLDQMVFGQPPLWGEVPFVTAIAEHNGISQAGNFLFDTGAQISVISQRLAIEIGLDSNGDGTLDQNDANFVTQQVVGGVGGQVAVPVFGFDEFHLPTDSGEELVWTNLEWLVLDIETPGAETSLDGVFGSDLLTSGWFHAFFSPGQPDGYINQIHMDFREMGTNGTAKVHFDLNPDVDKVILPGPGIIVRQSFRTTDVGEGGETDSYHIVLTGAPNSDVTITLANPDGQVTAVNAADGSNTLVFTPANWETVQAVLVTAVNDVAAEGNHSTLVTHAVTSADPGYDGRSVPDVKVRITDDDLNLLKITSDQAGLNPISSIDAVEGGDSLSYWVSLSEQPVSEIWVVIEDTKGQATAVKAVNPQLGLENVLMFNAGNWNLPQRVALSAVNDVDPEGPHQAKMVHTVLDVVNFSDPIIGATPLSVNITDDDLGVVVIAPSDGSTELSEAGVTDTYEVSLNMVPSGVVEITVQADAQTLVSVDDGLTFAASQVLAFTSTAVKTITIRAIDDDIVESTHFGKITHAVTGAVNDTRFPASLSIASVTTSITDNDVAGLAFSPASSAGSAVVPQGAVMEGEVAQGEIAQGEIAQGEIAQGETTPGVSIDLIEAGGHTLYAIALTSKPNADVIVFLSNPDHQASVVDAANPSNAFLTFSPENWNQPQNVRAAAIDDGAVEGIQDSQIAHNTLSSDVNYRGSVVLPITITDDDVADFGDAPAPYPTKVADGGAYHIPIGPRLGANRDSEIDGVATARADGDDDSDPIVNDEDGVQFGGIQFTSAVAAVNIFLENAESGKVDAWIDFDRDGVWAASEKILDSVVVSNAMQTLNYSLPAGVTVGDAFARVRLSTDGNLGPTGAASDGEVEDYLIHIVSAPTVESVVINHGDTQRSAVDVVTVTFDRIVDFDNLAFQVVNLGTNDVVTGIPVLSALYTDKTVVDIAFAVGPSVTSFGSLVDGDYRLTIDASFVSYFGVNLDGDRNGFGGDAFIFGESKVDGFFRKYGDASGNGVVDLLDFAEFRRTFGKTVGETGYTSGYDSDGDRSIGLSDFAAFRRNFGT